MTRSPDPIFAAIAAHRAAYEAYPDVWTKEALREHSRLEGDECEAFQALGKTAPATLEGVRALVAHLRWFLDAEEEPLSAVPARQDLHQAYALQAALSLALGAAIAPVTPATRWAVERRFPDGSVARLGTVRWVGDGYRFTPNGSGRRASRKSHGTLAACLPDWVGYPHRCETRALGEPPRDALALAA